MEIGLLRRLRAGRQPAPTRKTFSAGAGRPLARGLWRSNSFDVPAYDRLFRHTWARAPSNSFSQRGSASRARASSS